MFLSTNTCDGKRECINQCPTKAIKFINGKAFSCLTCGKCYEKLYIPTQTVKKFFGLIKKNDVYLAESFRKSEDFELIFEYNPKFEIDYRK